MNKHVWLSGLAFALLGCSILVTGCASSGSSAGDPGDVVGTWEYVVPDAADALNLRQGTIVITTEEGLLSGTISALHFETRPLLNVRYSHGELTFRAQSWPGVPEGVGFSLDPDGDTMVGTAFPVSGTGSVEAGSRQSGSRRSTNLRLTRTG